MKTALTFLMALCLLNTYAQDYLKLGDECYNKKEYTCARENYQKAIAANLTFNKSALYYRIGVALSTGENNPSDARKWFWLSMKEKYTTDASWSLAYAYYKLRTYDSSAFYYVQTFNNLTTKPEKLRVAYWTGQAFYMSTKYDDAIKWANQALTLEPADHPSFQLRASAEFEKKDYAAAEKSYTQALAISPDTASLRTNHYQLAKSFYNQKKYTEAIPHYRRVYDYDPFEANAFSAVGDCYQLLKQYDSADHYYKRAASVELGLAGKRKVDSARVLRIYDAMVKMRLVNNDTVTALQKSLPFLFNYNPTASATQTYMNLVWIGGNLKTLEMVLPAYIKVLLNRNMVAEAAAWQSKLGYAYHKLKQPAKALQQYQSAMALLPKDKGPLVDYIGYLIDDNKVKAASDTLKKRIANIQSADISELKLLEAEIAYKLKDTVLASKICKEVIAMPSAGKPYNYAYNANYLLGRMAFERKDSSTTAFYWERIRIPSVSYKNKRFNQYDLHRFLAFESYKKGLKYADYFARTQYQSAVDHFKLASAIDSSNALEKLFHGSALIMLNNRSDAYKQLEQAVKLYNKKKDTVAIIYRMMSKAEYQNTPPSYAGALGYLALALTAVPNDTLTISDLGVVQYQLKEYTKAATEFAKLIKLYKSESNVAVAYYNRALCHYQNKDKAAAMADVEKAIALSPTYDQAKKLKVEIEKLSG